MHIETALALAEALTKAARLAVQAGRLDIHGQSDITYLAAGGDCLVQSDLEAAVHKADMEGR